MGPSSLLGEEAERKMVLHVQKLQARGFAPTRTDLRELAFRLAEKMGLKHKFNREKGLAGYDWLVSFLARHKNEL